MTEIAVQAPEVPESVNSFGRIFGVLFSPKETFQSIARKPNWLLPLVVVLLISLAAVGIFGYRGGWGPFLEKQVANNARFQQLSAAQQQQAMQTQLKIVPRFVYAEVAVVICLAAVIIAAILLGVFNGLMGAKLTFKTSLAIVTHSWMPGIVSGILAILIVSVKDPASIDIQNIVASNVGAFLSSDSPKWLVSLCGSLDVFSFWQMILLGIGFGAADPKQLSFGKAFGWIFGLWLVFVLAKVGLVAAFT
jgi:Yip1 domain